jgi:hypothetical protein
MPSCQDASAPPESFSRPPTPAQAHASPASPLAPHASPAGEPWQQAARLAEASRALWLATLALMTAFMQTPAPAHRHLLARRISRNLDTLSRQECFDAGARARFDQLARRWQLRSEQFARGNPAPASSLLRLFS